MSPREYGKYTVLVPVLLGQLITPLDGAMVNVALPSIGESLSISISEAGWVLSIYFLLTCSFMVTFGRLGDIYGRKKLFMLGTALFICGTTVSSLSSGYAVLLVGRALQGAGGGMLSAIVPALVTAIFPPRERGKALGITATTVSVGLAVGPFLGGALSDLLGWRFVFLVTIPFGLAALGLGLFIIPGTQETLDEEMDFPGALLLLSFLGPLALALSQGKSWGWGSRRVTGLLLVAVFALVLFVLRERRSDYPIFDLELLKIPAFTLGNLASFSSYIGMQITLFATPFFLQYFMEMKPIEVGLVMMVANTVSLFILLVSGALSDRIGTLKLEVVGMVLFSVSLGLLAFAGSRLTLAIIVASLAVLGLAYGVFRSPNYSSVMGSVPAGRLGFAGGVYGTMRTTGFLTGIAVASSVLGPWGTKGSSEVAGAAYINNPAFQSAIRNTYLVAFLLVLTGLAFCLARFRYGSSGPVS